MTRAPLAAVLLLPVACLATACSGGSAIKGDKFSDGTVAYEVSDPGEGWSEINVDNANVAWIHDATAAALLVNSHCEGVEDANLQVLTRHLTIGMDDRKVLEEKTIEASRRQALMTTLTATIDGVQRKLRILVLKKDGCVYDVVLSANPDHWEVAVEGFDRVVTRFEVQQRADRR
jgi:hypothetical protein